MKTWCVAVLLSFVSVCRATPLTCEKLLTPRNQDPDLSGRWHLHAMTTESCFLMLALLGSSLTVNFNLKETPNIYNVTLTAKMLELHTNHFYTVFVGKNSMFMADEENRPTGLTFRLLPIDCSDSDAIVMNVMTPEHTLMYYSRRETLSAAELKWFETLAAWLNLPSPQVFLTEYDYSNSKNMDQIRAEIDKKKEKLGLDSNCTLSSVFGGRM